MSVPDNDHDRIIYMRKALDATCQILSDEGFQPEDITLAMFNFSVALMSKRISFDFAIETLTNTIAYLREHETKEHLH